MKRPYRYVLYFFIGFLIYYLVGADKDPTVLNGFHKIAPALIIGVIVLMIIVRYVINKQKKDNDKDEDDE